MGAISQERPSYYWEANSDYQLSSQISYIVKTDTEKSWWSQNKILEPTST